MKKPTDLIKELSLTLFALEQKQIQWRDIWKDVATFVLPFSGRLLDDGNTDIVVKAKQRRKKIINGVSKRCLRIFASGIQAGLTSRSRSWFRPTVDDKQLLNATGVNNWLQHVREVMQGVLNRTNFYDMTDRAYMNAGAFGTVVCVAEENIERVINFHLIPIGEFYISENNFQEVDLIARKFYLTARQMELEYGRKQLSDKVIGLLDKDGCSEELVEIRQIIREAEDGTYESFHWEAGNNEKLLRIGHYRSKPFGIIRWDVESDSVYGVSPAIDALPDIKQLQKMTLDMLLVVEKHVNPPLNAPAVTRREGANSMPNSVNYTPDTSPNNTITPTYQTSGDANSISQVIQYTIQGIKEWFFNDLFMAITAQTRTMTAREIAERTAEKLGQVGHAVERIENEFLNPLLSRTFEKCVEFGMIMPPPDALLQSGFKVEYLGTLAQAQKMNDVSSIEQMADFIMRVAQGSQDGTVIDKIDIDQTIDEYAERIGSPATMLRDDETVAQLRQAREQQQQEAAQAQQALQEAQAANNVAGTAQKLSAAKLTGQNNALNTLMGGFARSVS